MESLSGSDYIYRSAKMTDLRAIYDIQNVPFRTEVFDTSLPSFEKYSAEREYAIKSGTEHYLLLEKDRILQGFTRFIYSNEVWLTTIWGKWLKTLCYASCISGFDLLKFERSVFAVRESNKRMVRVCVEFGFHLAEQAPIVLFFDGPPHIQQVMMNYYLITPQEWNDKREEWSKKVLSLKVQLE